MKSAFWMRRLGLVVLGAVLLVGLAFLLTRVGPMAPVRISVAPVQSGSLQPAIFGIGTVEARSSWTVGPTTTGRVLRVLVDVGDAVQAGQLLAEMDPVDQAERLAAVDASVLRALSAQSGARAQWDEAQARGKLASINARRNEELAVQNFISVSALEARQTELQQARAGIALAQANMDSSVQEVERLKADRAGLLRQRGMLRMLAPAGSVVLSRDAEPGSTVVAGQPLMRLMDPRTLWVRMRVDQGRSAGLVAGLPARITLRSRPGVVLNGHVVRVESLADSVTEERIAQVALELPSGETVSVPAVGELAEVTLNLPATSAGPWVSNASIQRRQGQPGVWRLQDGRPQFVLVRLGVTSLDGQVQVLQSLQVGDSVVVHSQTPLQEGQRVRIEPQLAKSAATP